MLVLALALMLGQAAGAVQPQQTSPLPGATPPTPTAPPAPAPPPGQSVVAPPPLGRVFASDHGIIFNAIRPDKVMDFEMVLAKLRDALANSKDPVRQQQGWGWKIYKQTEPGPNVSSLEQDLLTGLLDQRHGCRASRDGRRDDDVDHRGGETEGSGKRRRGE